VPYLIDGNNLLGSWGGPLPGDDRRQEVVRRVSAFCRAQGARATLVFDGGPLRGERPEQDFGPVALRFPPRGQDADTVIRGLVDGAAHPAGLVVVTSDKALYSYAHTRGARVMRAHEWNALERSLSGPAGPRQGRGRGGGPDDEKPGREDDLAGWLERFSRKP
jgi:predicted RNA-binding protein with PIN domain